MDDREVNSFRINLDYLEFDNPSIGLIGCSDKQLFLDWFTGIFRKSLVKG